ncbi:hypothetical protein [Kitasatospora sp. NPDC001175]|uniref:hypothetical protein n=1 Tax=Kitasatospora sp. NPDC001175 TaxID=3157103 RepID=UPI003CFCA72B
MPRAEHIDPGFSPGSTADQRQLAAALRLLCAVIPASHASICKELHIGKSTLSGYLKASRIPGDGELEAVYELAEKEVGATGVPMPVTLDELFRLARAARVRHCLCCPIGHPAPDRAVYGPEERPGGTSAPREPAEGGFPAQRQHSAAGTGTPLDGDRRLKPERAPIAAVMELAQYLTAGRLADARTLMHHAAVAAPVEDIPEFVSGCRETGLHEAADSVLHYAARRNVAAVLELAARLVADESFTDVAVLLGAAMDVGA